MKRNVKITLHFNIDNWDDDDDDDSNVLSFDCRD